MTTGTSARYLLLLPPPPDAPEQWKAAYDETISKVLKEIILHTDYSKRVLEVAFALPHLVGSSKQPRSQLYVHTQRSLAKLYKLIVVIAARDNINIEDSSGTDVRVLPVAWSPSRADAAEETYSPPVVDLQALASSQRAWQYAFGVESDAGEAMVKAFVAARQHNHTHHHESTNTDIDHLSAPDRNLHVAVGGTFDHLHIGHKLLLTMTLFAVDVTPSSSIVIGLTGDELLRNKKYSEMLESWHDREKVIQDFCDSLLDFTDWPSTKRIDNRDEPVPNGKSVDYHYNTGLVVRCTQIQDPFGPTITDEQISALILSAETRAGGEAINKKRAEKQWAPLQVFEVDVLDAEEDGAAKEGFEAKLSSTAIRQKLASKTA